MRSRVSALPKSLALLLFAAAIMYGTHVPAATTQPQPTVATQMKAIDTDCLAIQDAVMALQPIDLIYAKSTWKIATDAEVTVAERTKASITIANVWKQGKNYAWVHSHSWDQKGNQSATQLCFRQSDGSLERVKQAVDIPGLNGSGARVGYYASNGTLIYKVGLFEENDPAIAKKVTELPYYKQLP